MFLSDGKYKTEHGSTVKLSKNGGASVVGFDWFEEPNACCDCEIEAYPVDGELVWTCEVCEGGSAKLTLVE